MEDLGNKVLIKINDKWGDECFGDSCSLNPGSKRKPGGKPQGFVEIFDVQPDGKKILVGKYNLVVYQGREWAAARIMNLDNAYITPVKEEFICWLGLGDGGTPPGDPLNPTSPTVFDTDLDSEIPINAVDSSCADFHGGFYYKHPFDSVGFEQDTANANEWLIIRVIVTIGADDANGQNISEVGLFTAASNSGGYGGPFNLFARVTFPTIVKVSTRQLVFVWYLYV